MAAINNGFMRSGLLRWAVVQAGDEDGAGRDAVDDDDLLVGIDGAAVGVASHEGLDAAVDGDHHLAGAPGGDGPGARDATVTADGVAAHRRRGLLSMSEASMPS
jgi:hypothetical protein